MPTIDFLWDEWSDNVLQETDENNVVTTYFQRPEKYGEVLYHKAGSRFSFYHFDGNGSTRKLTNVSQSTIKTYIFSGFGELVASSGTGSTPFAYKGAAGYYTNPVTNDIYVRARTYQPVTGRWLSRDPLTFVDGPNLYRAYFVPNGLDPDGLMSLSLRELHCSGCGDQSAFWGIKTDGGTYVIQKICFSLTLTLCEPDDEQRCCTPTEEKSCRKCIFERLLIPDKIKVTDHWKLPFKNSPWPRCGYMGHGVIRAEVRELGKSPEKWNPPGSIGFCDFPSIDVGEWLPCDENPDWWINAKVLDRRHSILSYVFDCCDSRDKRESLIASSVFPFVFKWSVCTDEEDPRR
jgi:RHS repeat-associated protein